MSELFRILRVRADAVRTDLDPGLAELQARYHVQPAEHEEVLKDLRDPAGPHTAQLERAVEVLQGLREDQHEAIEHVLTHHRLAVAAVAPGQEHESPRLLGWVTPDGRAASVVPEPRSPPGPYLRVRTWRA